MNKKVIHKKLAEGRWFQLSLCEQLGNIGSEVDRALHWKNLYLSFSNKRFT